MKMCLECGLIHDDPVPKKRLFKKNTVNLIEKCPYCKSRSTIDITDCTELAPFIMELRKHNIMPIGHELKSDADTGSYHIGFHMDKNYDTMVEISSVHGDKMNYWSIHPDKSGTYLLEANFKFTPNTNANGLFASFEYINEYSNMVREFSIIMNFIDLRKEM